MTRFMMHRARAACALAAVMAACGGGADPSDRPIPESIRVELVAMGRQDQVDRADLTPERMQDTPVARGLIRADSARSARLRAITDEYGWPDSMRAGASASYAAFLVLQHSPDHAFQKEWAPTLEELARRQEMPRSDVAMLIDRVLMHEGLPQRYGTQFTLSDGRWVLHPVEDEAGLDERRAAMQLPPMDEYARMMEEFYGAPVER